jgi:hypothetical protein
MCLIIQRIIFYFISPIAHSQNWIRSGPFCALLLLLLQSSHVVNIAPAGIIPSTAPHRRRFILLLRQTNYIIDYCDVTKPILW